MKIKQDTSSHWHVIFQDSINYQEQQQVKRRQGLQKLTEFLQDEGFYEDGVCDLAKCSCESCYKQSL